MNILLLSDTHGDFRRIDSVLENCQKPDLIIHLGDMERDGEYITMSIPPDVAFLSVRGNNEWSSNRPLNTVIELEGIRFYMTHGHKERVKSGHEGLIHAAGAQNCQVALYGHTHNPCDLTENGIRIINPGALAYPVCSYAMLHIKKGNLSAEFYNL